MLEQQAAALPSVVPAPGIAGHTAGMVVSLTLSSTAVVTAVATLFKVGRWMGRRESNEIHTDRRLDEIAADVRDVRAFLLNQGAK